jgi:hypothetical protein
MKEREKRVVVKTALELIQCRQDAVKAGRETRPWQSWSARMMGLYDPHAPGGAVLYMLSEKNLRKTARDKQIPLTVQVSLGSVEGWEAVFGGPVLYFD